MTLSSQLNQLIEKVTQISAGTNGATHVCEGATLRSARYQHRRNFFATWELKPLAKFQKPRTTSSRRKVTQGEEIEKTPLTMAT